MNNKNNLYFKIGNRQVGIGQSVFIVAEISANHLQKFDYAIELIKVARKAGADAVKFQTYTPDTLTIDCDNKYFQIKQGTIWDGKTLYQLYKEAYTPWEWLPKLKKIAEKEGLIFFSSVFDKTSVDFLEKITPPAYKIASFEITDIPLIEYVARKKKPIIISTGIATLSDIKEAVNTCKKVGNNQIILLKCTSVYPTPLEEVNLRTIPNLKETFKTVIGLSDHTLGISIPIAAVALGAKIIEKHLTLDRSLGGPDAAFSLEPDELKELVKSVRQVEKSIGKVQYGTGKKESENIVFRRSLFVVEDINTGEKFSRQNVRCIRPGYGLEPRFLSKVLSRRTKKSIKRGTPLNWNLIL